MLSSIVIEAFKQLVYVPLYRLDGIYPSVQIHLIGNQDSPDHYSVYNKEVKVPLTLQFVFFWWISISFQNSFSKKFFRNIESFFFYKR